MLENDNIKLSAIDDNKNIQNNNKSWLKTMFCNEKMILQYNLYFLKNIFQKVSI